MNAERWGDSDAHKIRRLRTGEGLLYRAIRLESLRESPEAFSSSYEAALGRDMESWQKQADEASEGDDRAIFVVQSDEPIGLVGLYRDPKNPCQGELVQMWVAPSARGGGAAEELLNHLLAWAASHSYKTIRAEVTDGNQRALRFYLRCGFTEVASQVAGILLVKHVLA